jgi:5'-nucleotidase
MKILIANDDGIYSPGLLALARCASRFGTVRIFAPDVEQSSMGHAITYTRPLSIKRTPIESFEAWRVNGTPADCVALGMSFEGGADIVLSGINLGVNLGNSAWHSGTLAAARQAVLLGARGIALSTPTGDAEPDFAGLEAFVHQVLERVLPEPDLQLVNVNLPREPKGLCWTRLAVQHYDTRVLPGQDPMGRKNYWLTIEPIEDVEQGTDRWAVRHQYVSLTPLRLDLTDEDALQEAVAHQPTKAAPVGVATNDDLDEA